MTLSSGGLAMVLPGRGMFHKLCSATISLVSHGESGMCIVFKGALLPGTGDYFWVDYVASKYALAVLTFGHSELKILTCNAVVSICV